MNNSDIVNLYIEKLIVELTEMVKTKILLQAQLEFLQKSHNSLVSDFNSLKEQHIALQEQINSFNDAAAQKQKKKESRAPQQSVETF